MSRFEEDSNLDGLSDYERQVLASWSATHNKSTLMLFVLLALTDGPGWSGDILEFLVRISAGHLGVDEQSLHRALRRLEGLNIITHTAQAMPGTGAKRKVYELTQTGERVLSAYLGSTMAYLSHPDFLAAVGAARNAPLPNSPDGRDRWTR